MIRVSAATIAVLFLAACQGDNAMDSPPASSAATDRVETRTFYYSRKTAGEGEVLAPPVLLRLSGTLEAKNGCLIVAGERGEYLLVFEKDAARFDPDRGILSAGDVRISVGDPISVGGPFNQPSDDFDAAAIAEQCGVANVWLVTGTDVRSDP